MHVLNSRNVKKSALLLGRKRFCFNFVHFVKNYDNWNKLCFYELA